MVFTKERHPHKWTLEEDLKLLELWKSESDWHERSAKMYRAFPARKAKGFFSPNACHAKFEKLIHTPAPNQIALPPNSTGFSLKSLVDIWIAHYRKEIEKECEREMEECLVGIRSSYALIDRLMSGTPEIKSDQLVALLEEARASDAKRNDDTEVIVNVYMRRLLANEEERKREEKPLPEPRPCVIPPTKIAEIAPRGSDSAFRSPSPPRSPIKSPIRRVADAVREGITPIKPITEPAKQVEAVVTPVKMEISPEQKPPTPVETPVKEPVNIPEEQALPEEEEIKEEPEPEVPIEASLVETPKSHRRSRRERESSADAKSQRGKNKNGGLPRNILSRPTSTDIEIKEEPPASPALQLSAPTSSVPTSRSRKRTTRTKKNEVEKKEPESRAESVAKDLTPVSTPLQDERFINNYSQTDIAIISASTNVNSDRKERRVSTSRKTRGNRPEAGDDSQAEVVANGERRDVGLQCARVEFDRDDRILITWANNERVHKFREKKVNKEDEEKTVLSTNSPQEEETKKPRPEKRDIIYDVDESFGRALLQAGYEVDDDGATPAKRANLRKDEKHKEEALQIKTNLLLRWRIACNHRHAPIFMHPVTEKEAPGYSSVIKERMDLTTLKKEIESGSLTSFEQFKHRLMKMFSNATIFNSIGTDVYCYTQEMCDELLAEYSRLMQEMAKATAAGKSAPIYPRRHKAEENTERPTRRIVKKRQYRKGPYTESSRRNYSSKS